MKSRTAIQGPGRLRWALALLLGASGAHAQQQVPAGLPQPAFGGFAQSTPNAAPQPIYANGAQPDYASSTDAANLPTGMNAGPFVVYPSIAVSESFNDNVLLSQTNRVRSAVTVISPALLAEIKGAATTFNIGYVGNFTRYNKSSADDYDAHAFRATALFDFTARARLNLLGTHVISVDPRGSTFASTGVSSPNKYHATSGGGTFSYGAIGAQGRLEVEALATSTRYENNRTVTQTLDNDSTRYGGTFFWRVAPKTEVLVQAVQVETDYNSPLSIQDNRDRRYLVGVKWEATAATTGIFKIGQSTKKYDSPLAPKQSSAIWEGGVLWSPLSYSKVTLTTGRYIADASGGLVGFGGLGATSVKTSFYNAAWNHQWTERISSNVRGGYLVEDYVGGVTNRDDRTGSLGLGVFYAARRWLTFAADYSYLERSSSVSTFDYKRNLMMFSVRAAM
jgi:hypothetical protein